MPSGKTHDQITLWLTPPVLVAGWLSTQELSSTLTLGLSFVFAGLMFSGDLDLRSVQYKRWGWLRWIWKPYQKMVSHRSVFSHGLFLGLIARLLYLSVVFLFFSACLGFLLPLVQQEQLLEQSQSVLQVVLQGVLREPELLVAALIGLWLGGVSHTLADELGSLYKRRKRRKSKKKHKKRSRKT